MICVVLLLQFNLNESDYLCLKKMFRDLSVRRGFQDDSSALLQGLPMNDLLFGEEVMEEPPTQLAVYFFTAVILYKYSGQIYSQWMTKLHSCVARKGIL